MDEAERVADRVAIIDSGKLLQLDTPNHLKRSIGRGDTLELDLNAANQANLSLAASKLEELGYVVKQDSNLFNVRGMDLVPKIHEIYKLLEGLQVTVSRMQVRENTLEDVFIHLTGKSLRQ